MLRKVFLGYLSILVVGLAIYGIWIGRFVRERLVNEIAIRLESNIDLVRRGLSSADLRQSIAEIARRCDARVTVVDANGAVLTDSESDPAKMDNHNGRPEVHAARLHGSGRSVRYSDSLHYDMLYIAKPLDETSPNGIVLRMALPLDRVEAEVSTVYTTIAIAFAVVGVGGAILGWLTIRHFSRPLRDIQRVADAIACGDMTQRAPVDIFGEVGSLSKAINMMGEELSLRLETIMAEKGKLETLLKSMEEGVAAIDADGTIVHINESAKRLLQTAQDAIHRPLWDVVRFPDMIEATKSVLAGQTTSRKEIEVNGRSIAIRASPIENIGGVILVMRDVTDSRRFDNLRKEFVANVSHELRTPLTMIKGYVETLREAIARDPSKTGEFLGVIEKHVNQLTRLVDDLLELSRLESPQGIAKFREVCPEAVLRKVEETFRPAFERKGQTFDCKLEANLPTVLADPDLLEGAILNLLDNSSKYTPNGGRILLTVKPAEKGIEIAVSDTGIGIPAADQPRIFERFFRVDKSRSRELGGTGLGLAIVKHIVQLHHGRVSVESVLDRGSTFTLFLPLNPLSIA